MRTRVTQDDLVVIAAESIVEAEWLRLQLDEHGETDMPTAKPVVRTTRPRVEAGTARSGSLTAAPLGTDEARPTPAYPPHHVWATQRSPPREPDGHMKYVQDSGGDASISDHGLAIDALRIRPSEVECVGRQVLS